MPAARRCRVPDPYHIANHRTRFLACLAATLVVLTVAVRFWPEPVAAPDEPLMYRTGETERIHIEDIQPTKQAASAPAPPTPLVPILVPDDEYLAEDELDLADGLLPLDVSGASATDPGEEVPSSAGVTAGPRAIRIVNARGPARGQAETSARKTGGAGARECQRTSRGGYGHRTISARRKTDWLKNRSTSLDTALKKPRFPPQPGTDTDRHAKTAKRSQAALR